MSEELWSIQQMIRSGSVLDFAIDDEDTLLLSSSTQEAVIFEMVEDLLSDVDFMKKTQQGGSIPGNKPNKNRD